MLASAHCCVLGALGICKCSQSEVRAMDEVLATSSNLLDLTDRATPFSENCKGCCCGGCNHFASATIDIQAYCLTFSDSPAVEAAGSELVQQCS